MRLVPWGKPALKRFLRYGDKCPAKLKGKVVAIDTETTGGENADVYTGARIFCYSYCSNEGEIDSIPKTNNTTRWIWDILTDPTMTVVFQNAPFDLEMIVVGEGSTTIITMKYSHIKAKIHDTIVMGVLMDELSPHDLGYMSRRYLGEDIDIKKGPKEWIKENAREFRKKYEREPNYSDVPNSIMVPYSKWDPEQTLKLFYYFKTPIMRDFKKLYENEMYIRMLSARMRQRGVIVDLEKCKTLRRQAKKQCKWISKRLNEIVGREFIIQGSGSRTDLIKVIEEDLQWVITKRTAAGNPELNEPGLMSFVDPRLHLFIKEWPEKMETLPYFKKLFKRARKLEIPKEQLFVPLLLKWRELNKMITTYYNPILRKAEPYPGHPHLGILHGRFNSVGAITGRFSSSDPNLQNIPRVMGPRKCFVCRPGYVNVHYDFSQMEMRFFIHEAKDRILKAELEKGKDGDLHLSTAERMFNKPRAEITKEERKRAKTVNFGVIYGSGAETLANTLTVAGIPTSLKQSRTFLNDYHRAMPSVKKVMYKCKGELATRGYVEDMYGRRYRVPMRLSYKALNAKIQGGCGNFMKFGMKRVDRHLRKNKYKSRIIMTIHDEIVIEMHLSEYKDLLLKIKEIMERDSHMYYVPITVDIDETRTCWAEKKTLVLDQEN